MAAPTRSGSRPRSRSRRRACATISPRKIAEDLQHFARACRRSRGRGMRRAVLIGTGSALPARRVSNAELAETVDTSRRLDRRAHRHPLPPHRQPRRDDGHARRRRGARGAGRGGHARRGDRPDRARDRDARPDLSGHRDQGPGDAGDRRLRRVRRRRGVLGLPLRDPGRRQPDPHRRRQSRAGDRVGDVQPHPRLGGPRDLRAVRRRRRARWCSKGRRWPRTGPAS